MKREKEREIEFISEINSDFLFFNQKRDLKPEFVSFSWISRWSIMIYCHLRNPCLFSHFLQILSLLQFSNSLRFAFPGKKVAEMSFKRQRFDSDSIPNQVQSISFGNVTLGKVTDTWDRNKSGFGTNFATKPLKKHWKSEEKSQKITENRRKIKRVIFVRLLHIERSDGALQCP